MLYVDWVSVDLNLTSRVFSGHSGFLPPQKATPSKNRTPFKLASLNWTFLYKYWNIIIIIIIIHSSVGFYGSEHENSGVLQRAYALDC